MKRVDWQNTMLVNKNLEEEVNKMKHQAGKKMVIVSKPRIARTFTKLNLIDEYQIYLHPIIYPENRGSLLETLREERTLKLIETRGSNLA